MLAWVKCTVRLGGIAAFLVSLGVLFGVHPGCTRLPASMCPAYAFNAPWILRAERAVVVLGVALIVLVVFVKTVIEGELPDVTTTGLKYARRESARGIKQLEGVVTDHATATRQATRQLASMVRALHVRLKHLEEVMGVPADAQLRLDIHEDEDKGDEVR
jgi:hypothetical protein